MRCPKQKKLQKTLKFEPQLWVNLSEAARAEAVSVLALVIGTVTGDSDRVENDGRSDE